MLVIAPYKALVHSEAAKNGSDWIVNSEPQLLRNCLFGGNSGKVGIEEFKSSIN
jgi:hypothetical protein